MGKEWLYWVGGNGGSSKSTKKRKSGGGVEREAPTPGCMCAVFQLFDLHHFQLPLNHHSPLKTESFLQFQDEPSTVAKGVEAPRNSLELVDTLIETAGCLSSAIKDEEVFNIPVGIQIKTTCENRSPRASTSSSKAKGEDLLSECSSSSPGAKTPNLVARLMGLDLLPESGSPSLSSSRFSTSSSTLMNSHMHPPRHSQKQESSRSRPYLQSRPCSSNRNSFYDNDITSSVSLPETPRISSARRSDVEHRLSLQMNRENIGEELELSACSAKKMARRRDVRLQDENRSPSSYARNIVKQVKESVSRKVGLDITNTLKSREQRRSDDHVVLLKPNKKPSPVLTRVEEDSSPSKQITPSCSPRFRFLDPKNKAITSPITKTQASQSPKLSPLSAENQSKVQEANVLLKLRPQVPVLDQQHKSVQKCKKAGNERFNSRLRKPPTASDAIRNKKEEPFVRSTTTNKVNISEKKSKKTPLSNELLPVRKDSSLPLTKLRDKQSQAYDALRSERSTRLSSCASRSYFPEEVTHTSNFQENIHDKSMCNGTASTSSVDEMEFQYVNRILKRTGLDKAAPVSLAKWFSPSHPLDPSIFHYIELFHPNAVTATTKVSRLSHRCNRKLIFQLIDELLVDILKPYINSKPWITITIPLSSSSTADGQSQMLYGSELIEELCRRIKNFPSANCQVLEDIDALIDTDLRKSQVGTSLEEALEEVGERIATEIERDIIESLVHE